MTSTYRETLTDLDIPEGSFSPSVVDKYGRSITIDATALVPTSYDYIFLDPATNPTTIIYKTGGSEGTTVATLTLTYSGDDITSITRT